MKFSKNQSTRYPERFPSENQILWTVYKGTFLFKTHKIKPIKKIFFFENEKYVEIYITYFTIYFLKVPNEIFYQKALYSKNPAWIVLPEKLYKDSTKTHYSKPNISSIHSDSKIWKFKIPAKI